MALPTDGGVDVLVCDAVRQDPDGKLTLAGFYATGEIRIDPNAPLPVALNLAFVFVMRDGDGDFRLAFRLYDPLGKELTNNTLPNVRKPAGQGQVVYVTLNQIPVATLGNYAVELGIDDRRYRRTIRIGQ